ncbi:glycosyl hydrolase [Paenibacillus taichungensis]|uniref:glycosyl hydrolase n=1 Tax=Paenibacillus taichungensis TaxID=484184 RepID=UPI002DBEA388|nr:glycosyl hydrolase [Paenibacillus taichungensis]MEC0107079.1 glycosyl hydrolase [Paenibacillus taichungensis]MEC0194989.1 glycosyl hydrolase [Paenibacillus taichungensis]
MTEQKISSNLVNKDATSEARELMKYLAERYGKGVLSGQQDYGNLNWINENTGRKPAVIGFDLMDYSPSRTERGAISQEIRDAIAWHRQGGIVTLCWHWNAPANLINEPGKEWWRGFYTDATTYDLASALAHPESEEYTLLIRDIDAIAVHLQELKEAGVPVLFRPLHEAEGGWFWWGAKGPEPAKQLYRLMYDQLVNKYGLGNLIWVWNSEKPDWYPGDDVVDIVSVDVYPEAGDHSPLAKRYENLRELVNDSKIIALAENGSIPDPKQMKEQGVHWSWFCTWTGEFLQGGNHNTVAYLKEVYNSEEVITLDQLPKWSWR